MSQDPNDIEIQGPLSENWITEEPPGGIRSDDLNIDPEEPEEESIWPPESYLSAEERTPCEVWTRVMGYHRPVNAFNPGKQAEHTERRMFREGSPAPV